MGLFRVGPSGDEVGGGQVGGRGRTRLIIPVFNDKKMLMKKDGGALFLFSLSPLVSSRSFDLIFFLVVSLKKESPDGCKAKNHKYWVPSFGEFNVLSSVKSLAQRQHYLVVLLLFVTI